MADEKLIYQGAEAEIIKTYYHGRKVVQKKRLSKSYRIKEIDNYLISTRTKEETKLIIEARKQGVLSPIVYDVDLDKGVITMEYIVGKKIKEILDDLGDKERKNICQQIGNNIAKLHNVDIIHGDITTSNMILSDGKIFFIDFGLGEINNEIEAKGVDLHVLMEAIESTHSQCSNCFDYVLEGYKSGSEESYAGDVVEKIDDIVRRGRYR